MTVTPQPSARRRRRCALILAVTLASALGMSGAGAAETITVVLDQAQLMPLPERVGTIIIGNPLIADVTLQAGGTMVITGKGYGSTNLIVLDRAGATVLTTTIQVVGPRDTVVVYRGIDRESYSCAPRCERRITLGDAPPYFDSTLGQAGARTGSATGAAAGR
jgi:putative type II/III system pilus formation protein